MLKALPAAQYYHSYYLRAWRRLSPPSSPTRSPWLRLPACCDFDHTGIVQTPATTKHHHSCCLASDHSPTSPTCSPFFTSHDTSCPCGCQCAVNFTTSLMQAQHQRNGCFLAGVHSPTSPTRSPWLPLLACWDLKNRVIPATVRTLPQLLPGVSSLTD
jgi:hypothetical protein